MEGGGEQTENLTNSEISTIIASFIFNLFIYLKMYLSIWERKTTFFLNP